MFVDPFGFTITENTPYDVIDKVTAGVSICSFFSLSFWVKGGGLIYGLQTTKDIPAEPQFPVYREVGSTTRSVCVMIMLMSWFVELCG